MHAGEQYEVVCTLGQGKYGTVSRARHRKLGSLVALKSELNFNLSSSEDGSCLGSSLYAAAASDQRSSADSRLLNREAVAAKSKVRSSLYHEARVLASLSHPGLVSLVEICVGVNGNVVLALEDLGSTSLTRLVRQRGGEGGLCDCLVGCVARHIMQALMYLHSRGYLHRDVKPDNIMVENTDNCFPNAKLIDLGLSIAYSEDNPPNSSSSRAGTLAFMAPELMKPDTQYGPKVDVFSLGTSLYFALSGDEPFVAYVSQGGNRSTTSIFGLQVQHEDTLDLLTPEVSEVLKSCLSVGPADRCTVEGVLQSQWVRRCVVGSNFVRHSKTSLPKLADWLALQYQPPAAVLRCIHASCDQACTNLDSLSDAKSSCYSSPSTGSSIERGSQTSMNVFASCSDKLSIEMSGVSSLSLEVTEKSPVEVLSSGGLHMQSVGLIPLRGDAASAKSSSAATCAHPSASSNSSSSSSSSICAEVSGGEGVCRVLGHKDVVCRTLSSSSCECSAPNDWEEEMVARVAEVLQQDPSMVVQRMTSAPWGEAAGIYNLLRMKDRQFSITDVIKSMHETQEYDLRNNTL